MKWFEHTINLAKRTKLIFNQGSLKKNTGNHVLLFHWKWSSQWGSIEGWSLLRESFHCNRSAWVMHGFHSIGRYSNWFNKLLIRMQCSLKWDDPSIFIYDELRRSVVPGKTGIIIVVSHWNPILIIRMRDGGQVDLRITRWFVRERWLFSEEYFVQSTNYFVCSISRVRTAVLRSASN